jgi:UDP-N-acetylglucosamine--N-acetylmuramyl-(pentapeptide) pyrophosphoryl-undecaprenol N-acetylglucosamine transferase
MRMVIAGGGTGGHVFPGLAVADAVRRAGGEVLFVGSERGIEAQVVPAAGYRLETVPIRSVRGRGIRGLAGATCQVPRATGAAFRILRRARPDIVVGTGGYVSFPVVVAAWLQRLPAILLEQNAQPGLATRALAPLARAVCTSFPETAARLRGARAVCTGNPVRQWAPQPRERSPGTFTLLVFGGSQGAHRINVEAVGAVRALAADNPGLRVIHQTGRADKDWVEAAYRDSRIAAEVHAFIDDMGGAYARADLVVCRAGATTVAELTALGKPAILIPYPFAADDHQRLNAEALERRGAALVLLDRDLTAAALAERVRALVRNPERLESMSRAARALGRPDAAERVLEVCRQVLEERARG